MLPPFDEYGNLPPGIHRCTIEEVVQRFGSGTSEREVESSELLQFVEWARRVGVVRLILNGSFITAEVSPNDVDLVILPGPDFPRDQLTTGAEEILWPFLQVLEAVDDADLEAWAIHDFGTDRNLRPKGVVEVIL